MSQVSSNSTLSAPSNQPVDIAPVVPYEELLARDLRWAMSEGSLFFEGKGRVQQSLIRIARKLDELGIPYAVADGMALFAHGHRRFTEDIDILITREDLDRVHQALDGLGWVRPFSKSKNLRDGQTGVRIEFLVAGEYPGDGKPKAVSFPAPRDAAAEIDGVKYVNLPTFIELKLASGMTGGVHRAKDLVDVGELIKSLDLRESMAESLNPYVRAAYLDLWRQLHSSPERYVMPREDAGEKFDAMIADGVMLEQRPGGSFLVTQNAEVARKYRMVRETEILD